MCRGHFRLLDYKKFDIEKTFVRSLFAEKIPNEIFFSSEKKNRRELSVTRVSGTCNYKCDKTLSMADILRLILRRGGGGTVPPKLNSAVFRSDKTLPILAHV